MPSYLLIFLCWFTIFAEPAVALSNDDLLPPEQAFKLQVKGDSRQQVTLSWQIAEGYYLYRDRMKFKSQSSDIALGQPVMPAGEVKHDPTFGEVTVYRGGLSMTLPLTNATQQAVASLFIQYQGCADVGVCYPPQKMVLDVHLPNPESTASSGAFDQFVHGLKSMTPGVLQTELLPPEQAFQFFATVDTDGRVHANWSIADGYFLYRNKLSLSLQAASQAQLGELPLPKGEAHHDEEFGDVEVYRHELMLEVPVQRRASGAGEVVLTAKFQGCADRGVCYPPMQKQINLTLPELRQLPTTSAVSQPKQDAAVSEQDRIVASLKQDSLALTLLSFFGFGLLLAHTPCVFPMIPILSGIIVGHGDRLGSRKAFLLSASFVLASALMYTIFGILAALFGSNLQAVFQQPWVIGIFSALFVLLSLSMFGFFDLQLPAALQSKLHHSSDQHRDGSYWGAAIMGAFSSLIVGPCVAAPLAAALIYIGQTGDVWLGGSALFLMGLGMGVPLLLIGASAGKLLPKSGVWMNSTKAVFGVIMLAVAVWMLSRIVPVEVTMFLTAMLLIIPAIYLNALEPLPQPVSGWKKLWKGIGLMMLALGILQLIGLGAGGTNPLQPLAGLAVAGAGKGEKASGLKFKRVISIAELDDQLRQAQAKGQWVMLDFYADWCISCKEMETYTFTDAQVQEKLRHFVVLQADVTANNAEDKALLKRFNLFGPPGIIFFAPDGQERTTQRVIGFQDANTFVKSLSQL